jgi:hypothetical protein
MEFHPLEKTADFCRRKGVGKCGRSMGVEIILRLVINTNPRTEPSMNKYAVRKSMSKNLTPIFEQK